jgi:hypothetical protein
MSTCANRSRTGSARQTPCSSDRFPEGISIRGISGIGRLLPHVPLQTGRCDDGTKAKRSTAQVDPQQALGNVRFQAVNPDTANYLTEHR